MGVFIVISFSYFNLFSGPKLTESKLLFKKRNLAFIYFYLFFPIFLIIYYTFSPMMLLAWNVATCLYITSISLQSVDHVASKSNIHFFCFNHIRQSKILLLKLDQSSLYPLYGRLLISVRVTDPWLVRFKVLTQKQ